jgi:thiomorpholine-carboxylate dehydrogenase
LAFLDGRLITEMRTAAVSTAETRHLAPEDASVLTMLGSDIPAHAHLQAHADMSRRPDHARRFAVQHGAKAWI